MSEIKIKRGGTINLKGKAQKQLSEAPFPSSFAIKPPDFHGVTPKLTVRQGDEVKAGDIIFFDKYNEKVKFASPVSGEIAEIVRGAKRRILEIKILPDKEIQHKKFDSIDINTADAGKIKQYILDAGLWPVIKQRPFDIIANPDDTPRDIYISAFNTEPLAADYDFIVNGQGDDFQKGLDALAKLTNGKANLNVSVHTKAPEFLNAKNVQINKFSGPHPAGNVGIQIHHLKPINKGETVWVISPQDVILLGRLFNKNIFDATRIIALAGSRVKNPQYVKTYIGAQISSIVNGNETEGDIRYISGGVLTGDKVEKEGYLGFYHSSVTIIPEGHKQRFLGWMLPSTDRFSFSRTFCSWLTPNKEYDLDTNLNGEERAFVVSGQYEQFIPMDIYPVHLLKACIIQDVEQMENLGIYEVAPEDFSLAEFACTSKINSQSIIREALDLVKKECS
ncbi:MAG: Na(+)-translocating NADH-quinone reductase subunit A [Bacteroidetes bacterium]|nr:MAG: Na(+)-translocating NADH-quinone reductase subunit A [Bacteroidota bacterium]